jgi:hypothetical protein
MSDQFVTVRLPRFLTRFRDEIGGLVDEVIEETSPILRRSEEASIRQRWYRSGRTLRSLKEEVAPIKDGKAYRLFPTATSERGAPYPLFGEFGTGRRGATSGKPTPKGYKHGRSKGMTARRFGREAVKQARPKVIQTAQSTVRAFARNVTVR